MKCDKCGSEIYTENGHIGFCKNKDCSNNTGVDLAGCWQARAEKAEIKLDKLKNISIISGDEIMDWLFENGKDAIDGAWHFSYHKLAEYINKKYQEELK